MKEIYVGNLAYDVTEDELTDFFREYGDVKKVKLITDRFTGKSKGFGFVEFATQAEAEKTAKAAHGKEWKGRALKVNMSRPKEKTGGSASRERY